MGSSKRKTQEPDEDFYSVRGILNENKTKYLTFEPTWEPKANVTEAAIQEWEEEKRQKKQNEEKKRQRKSADLPASSSDVVQIDDNDDDDNDEEPEDERPLKATKTSGSKPSGSRPRIMLKYGKRQTHAAVEVTPTKPTESAKRKPGRPRRSLPGAPDAQSSRPHKPVIEDIPDAEAREDDEDEVAPKPLKRGRGRPRKSLPTRVVQEEKEQGNNGEDPSRLAKSSPLARPRLRLVNNRKRLVNISSDEDEDVPLEGLKRKRPVISASSDVEVQHAREGAQPTAALPAARTAAPKRRRGRPRKYPRPDSVAPSPMTPAVISRPDPEEVGTTEIEDSEMYDAAAAQLQRETRSARKQPPGQQPSADQQSSPGQQSVRDQQPSPEFDEGVSDFRSSQIIRGTQPEPHRTEEQTSSLEELTDSQFMVDAAAASSLSAKNSPYEPGATSESTFVNSTVNSSTSVHTLPIPVAHRFGVDAVIPDSQSFLDASSVHISEHRVEAEQPDQVESSEDATTESQIVVEPEDIRQVVAQDLPVSESSMAQSDVAGTATQSEPSLGLSTRNIIATAVASSVIAQVVAANVSTRSPSPVSLGAVRSSSTSSAPPTEAADKSTQSQSQSHSQPHQHSSSKSHSKSEASVEASSSSAIPNQETSQNTASGQAQAATTQQSHVEQAAQQISFQLQQPPVQQIVPFEFAQSPAEEATTSSLEFATQIASVQQAPAPESPSQPASVQDIPVSSSPIASPPSKLPNTIGESAPSLIKSVSDPELNREQSSREQTPASDMTSNTNPDGTPVRVSMVSRLRAMKAASAAKLEADLAGDRAALAAFRAGASTPVPSRVAAPLLDTHSPKPASAIPARLMSPAAGDREARSPSTVPPVEILPDETPEEYSRSERYETLLPGQGPQINADTSRPYILHDVMMPDVSVDANLDDNQHLISLDFGVLQRDHYKCAFDTDKALIEGFTMHKVWPADSEIAEKAREFIAQLHCIVNHLDLNNPGASQSSQTTQSLQADWDMTMSSKFRFLKSLLDAAKRNNLHVALLVDQGRLAGILQSFLQGIHIMYNVINGQDNVINQESTATILLTSVESVDKSSLDMDMVVVIDGCMPKDTITRTQKMLSRDTLIPTVSLIIPCSIEHAERCLVSTMSEAERLHVLISTVTGERSNAGWQSGGTDTDFEHKASEIVSWILNPDAADWLFYGLPELQLIEAISSQSTSEDEFLLGGDGSSNKRQLNHDEVPSAKRVRVDESLPMTINPADIHITPGTLPVSNSHVSDSVTASQHAAHVATLQQLNRAQAEVREHVQAMERLQYNSEEQRAQMVQAQKERNEALQREERLSKSNIDLRAKNTSLRDEVLDLKKQLETARAALADHTVPERAELEKSKAETLAATAEYEKEAKRAKQLEEAYDYLREQYQNSSNSNTELTDTNIALEQRIAHLEVRASGEQARLKLINNDTLNKNYEDTIKKLTVTATEREGTMQRMSDEVARLREPRGRVGTRASSIPRSPRGGTREPLSRQGSPSVQRPHPLRQTD
ncbi:unnamed protein product [Aureobasidium uvarum]|uniref:Chromo domain-containing protein n=1 Tax=Aureobasidium uvarum TaxID=2773716 RepID=A0A9N8PVF8_9PEZI|nr:unnamed protein product [Aureobasidium uvarum]